MLTLLSHDRDLVLLVGDNAQELEQLVARVLSPVFW
jgi:hypothetical protein